MAASPVIVQYVAMRVDLMKTLKWPTGAVIAQACHACTAVMHGFYSDACTQAYLLDVDRMHKVVVEVSDETTLRKLSETLTANNIDHKLWIEQPENIATCLATKPYIREDIKPYFSAFKLYR